MIYNANSDNGRWGPEQVPPEADSSEKVISKIRSFGGWVFLGLVILAVVLMGVAYGFERANLSGGSGSSSSSSSVEGEYLDLLESEGPHTFASDADAVEYGYAVCELLDEYWLEDIAGYIQNDRSGGMRGVSIQTRGSGLVAATSTICPEHFPEVFEWVMSGRK